MSLFILAGNTGYPIFLRTAVWALWKILPDNEQWKEDRLTLRFLLDHPRRVYTNLFPSRHTWWLAASLVVLNGIDWMFFELLSVSLALSEKHRESEVDDVPADWRPRHTSSS